MIDGLTGKIIFPVKDLMAVSSIFEEFEVFKGLFPILVQPKWGPGVGNIFQTFNTLIFLIGKSYSSDKT